MTTATKIPQNTSTDGRHGEVVISQQIRSTVSHGDPGDIVTFGERRSETAAFLTFHQSFCDSISMVNLFLELILGSDYKLNKVLGIRLFFLYLIPTHCLKYFILTEKSDSVFIL